MLASPVKFKRPSGPTERTAKVYFMLNIARDQRTSHHFLRVAWLSSEKRRLMPKLKASSYGLLLKVTKLGYVRQRGFRKAAVKLRIRTQGLEISPWLTMLLSFDVHLLYTPIYYFHLRISKSLRPHFQ